MSPVSRFDPRKETPRAVAATLFVALVLLVPIPEVEGVPPGPWERWLDELVHLALFAGLAVAWRRSGVAAPFGNRGLLALGGALVAYGALLELAQGATGWRTAEWGDLAADALGVALVLGWAARPQPAAAGLPRDAR